MFRAVALLVSLPSYFRVVALLASFANPSHILMYAPGDPLICRLATTRTILGVSFSDNTNYIGSSKT